MITTRLAPRRTEERALNERNPRKVRLSLGVPVSPVGANRSDCPEGEVASGERSLVLLSRWSDDAGSMLTSGTVHAE